MTECLELSPNSPEEFKEPEPFTSVVLIRKEPCDGRCKDWQSSGVGTKATERIRLIASKALEQGAGLKP